MQPHRLFDGLTRFILVFSARLHGIIIVATVFLAPLLNAATLASQAFHTRSSGFSTAQSQDVEFWPCNHLNRLGRVLMCEWRLV
jgi:hypothetical protein